MNEDMTPTESKPARRALPTPRMEPIEKKVKTLSPKQKKELIIVNTRMNLMEIKFAGGGQVPEMLTGEWNNRMLAQRKIELYLAGRR